MKRFILLSFGFLGWAFYELSGGDEFESASARVARLAPAPEVTVSQVDEAAPKETVTLAAAETVIDTDPPESGEVSRVSLNLTTLQDAQEEVAETAAEVAGSPTIVDPETGVAVNTGLTLASADTPAIIPSLIAPNNTSAATVQTASLQGNANGSADIRTVSGNRVNVRGGPGTDFGIVGKLVRGDAVEILQDDGNGWVLMRSVETGDQGWLADFLLNS